MCQILYTAIKKFYRTRYYLKMLVIRSRIFISILILTVIVLSSCIWMLQLEGIRLENALNTKQMLQLTENEQIRRQTHVANVCHKLNSNDTASTIPPSLLDHLIVDDEHKLIYCYVPKVACTNWKRVLLVLRDSENNDPSSISGNKTHLPNVFKTLNQYSSEEIQEKLTTYLKFLFVRHPYERVLSAYRNKLENSYGNYFRVRFGTEIIKKYRNSASKESLVKGHDVNFEEFLLYITNLSTKDHKILFNEHWRPVFDLCFPCHFKYDIIGKYETLDSDAEYTLWKAGLSGNVKFPKRELSYKQQPTSDMMHNYYKNVSHALHHKLFELYKEDFALFEYKPHK